MRCFLVQMILFFVFVFNERVANLKSGHRHKLKVNLICDLFLLLFSYYVKVILRARNYLFACNFG